MTSSIDHMTHRQKRGFEYEQQVRNHISIQPDVEQAWLWSLTPERILEDAGIIWDFDLQRVKRRKLWDIGENHVRDTGTDIVVKKPDSYELVQAKNFTSRRVYETDLTGFLHHMVRFSHLSGSVYSNTAFHEDLLQNPPGFNRIQFIRYQYIEPTIKMTGGISEKDLVLRDYQVEAVTNLRTHFLTEKRAILSLICGLGKTVVAAHVAKEYEAVIILSPYCAHAEQNLRRFSDMLPEHEPMLITHNGCRDAKRLSLCLEQNRKAILSATYDSADVVVEIMTKLSSSTTMFCLDEFHNLSVRDIIDHSRPINRILRSEFRALFLSATPRVYRIEEDDDEQAEEATLELFGDLKIGMSLREAIEKKFVTDYRVFIPMINEMGDEVKYKEELSVRDVDTLLLSKALFLVKCMLYEGTRKTIVFLSSQEEVDAFYSILNQVAKKYFGIGEDFWIGRIVSETTVVERREHLRKFSNHEGFAALLNIRVCGECLDIKTCDSVMFASVCRSKIAAVQRLCRANRINPDDPDKIAKIFLWADAEDDLTTFISALKEIDPEFPSKLTIVSRKYAKTSAGTKTIEETQTKSTKEFAIGVREFIGDSKERAISKAREYAGFYNNFGRHPSQQATDDVERNLAHWANNYRRGLAGSDHFKERPEVNAILDNLPHWRDTRTATAVDNKIAPLREFIERNGRLPGSKPGECNLNQWLCRQRGMATGKSYAGHKNYVRELDEAFGHQWRKHYDFSEIVKMQGAIRRIFANYRGVMPRSERGLGQESTDYNFLTVYKSGLTGSRTGKDMSKDATKNVIKLMYEKIPHLMPTRDQVIDEFKHLVNV